MDWQAIQFIFLNVLRNHPMLVTIHINIKDGLVKTAFIQCFKQLVTRK